MVFGPAQHLRHLPGDRLDEFSRLFPFIRPVSADVKHVGKLTGILALNGLAHTIRIIADGRNVQCNFRCTARVLRPGARSGSSISTRSSLIARYVVYLPPAMWTTPSELVQIRCPRLVDVADLPSSGIKGRSALYAATGSARYSGNRRCTIPAR